ncbi:hypothetical protein EC991_000175 [Linnemannia zychae]|nr:hypothetical protein EC991_000175 [Linnemannia zychae]
MRAIDQLGLREEVIKESLPIGRIRYYDRMENSWSKADSDGIADIYGNAIRTIPRSVLVDLLLARIPRHKILLGKRVVRTKETTLSSPTKLGGGGETGYVTCYCDDGSEYRGSILVGADGTYSAVRKSMYQSLSLNSNHIGGERENEDVDEFMRVGEERVMPHQHCVVGITKPLDPLEFEALGEEYGEFHALRGKDHKHSIWLMPLTDYRVAWNVFFHFPEDLLQEYKDLQTSPTLSSYHALEGSNVFLPGQCAASLATPSPPSSAKSSVNYGSWRSVSKRVHDRAQTALEDLRDVPNPLSKFQGRFGDLLDKTDPEKITRVTLEQGVFRRWFHGRTVLLGDAAHKSLPYAGQGANQAILDCIYLVSKIYLLVKPNPVPAAVASVRRKVAMPIMPPMVTRLRMARLSSTPSSLNPKPTSAAPKFKWRTPKNSELTRIFEQYYAERSAIAQQATWGGSWADIIFGGQGWGARTARFAFFKLMPVRAFYLVSDPYFRLQPLLPFLPDVAAYESGKKNVGVVTPTVY